MRPRTICTPRLARVPQGPFPRSFQLYPAAHAPCNVPYVTPVLLGC